LALAFRTKTPSPEPIKEKIAYKTPFLNKMSQTINRFLTGIEVARKFLKLVFVKAARTCFSS